MTISGAKARGVLEVGFCKHVRLSWLWHSECQMYCWAQYPWLFCVSLGVTLDSAETPFAETPLSVVKQRGREKNGAARYCPTILLPKRVKMVLCSFHRSHRDVCTRDQPLSKTKFLDAFWGALPLPAPLVYCWPFEISRFLTVGCTDLHRNGTPSLISRIKFSPPPPTSEFLSKDFPSATRSRTEILTKENLVGTKIAPTAVSRTFTPLVRGIRFP